MLTHKSSQIAILGSCVSRDPFDSFANRYSIHSYIARTSFASLFTSKFALNADIENIPSSWQRRMVEMDVGKEAVPLLDVLDTDWLLIDFIDERNSLLVFEESTASLSVGLETLLKGSYGGARLIRNNTPEFKELWVHGWEKFAELMRSIGMANRCVLHKVWFAEKDSDGVCFDTAIVEKGNAYLEFFYKHATENFPEMRIIEVPKTLLVGDVNHKWGRAPFHYVKEQHKFLLDHLQQGELCFVRENRASWYE